jgi:hypothetical protein
MPHHPDKQCVHSGTGQARDTQGDWKHLVVLVQGHNLPGFVEDVMLA